jgi:putative (di)nucleoside polyphosphate hydrolase
MTSSTKTSGGGLDLSRYRPCVGILVLNRAGLAWIGRRWWQMPQGGIDADEDPESAARRELIEETGMRSVETIGEIPRWLTYDLPADLKGKVWGGRFIGQRQRWFAMRFLGSDKEINITPPDPDAVEFDAWRWAPLSEVSQLIVPFKRSVYEIVTREFAPLARPL